MQGDVSAVGRCWDANHYSTGGTEIHMHACIKHCWGTYSGSQQPTTLALFEIINDNSTVLPKWIHGLGRQVSCDSSRIGGGACYGVQMHSMDA